MSLGRDMWAQDFAAALGLSASPSLLGGTNFAFGATRTGPLNPVSFRQHRHRGADSPWI